METNYKDSVYMPRFFESNEYLDWICIKLHAEGIVLQNRFSKKYQWCGENLLGMEIKHDLLLRETGNVWIEIEEKSNPSNPEYVKSGIYRNDNSWLFGIGNDEIFFIFSKRTLRLVHEKRHPEILENNTKTSRGFLIKESDALSWCEKVFYFRG